MQWPFISLRTDTLVYYRLLIKNNEHLGVLVLLGDIFIIIIIYKTIFLMYTWGSSDPRG